jgi:hypothetical protein
MNEKEGEGGGSARKRWLPYFFILVQEEGASVVVLLQEGHFPFHTLVGNHLHPRAGARQGEQTQARQAGDQRQANTLGLALKYSSRSRSDISCTRSTSSLAERTRDAHELWGPHPILLDGARPDHLLFLFQTFALFAVALDALELTHLRGKAAGQGGQIAKGSGWRRPRLAFHFSNSSSSLALLSSSSTKVKS